MGIKVLMLHTANPGSIPSNTYDPLSLFRSDPWIQLGTAQNTIHINHKKKKGHQMIKVISQAGLGPSTTK